MPFCVCRFDTDLCISQYQKMNNLKLIQQVNEAVYGKYNYRFTTDENGSTYVKRARNDDGRPLWGHGVLTESISVDEDEFDVMIRCGMLRKWPTLQEAITFIEGKFYASYECRRGV